MPDICESFLKSHNPRISSCLRCGRFREAHPSVDPTRDLAFESEFLAKALETAQRLTGILNGHYPGRVHARLTVGKERYGDGDYLEKDNLTEVLEETPDLCAYAVLELQKLRRQGIDPALFEEVYLDLIAVAAYGAVADFYADRAGRRLRGEE